MGKSPHKNSTECERGWAIENLKEILYQEYDRLYLWVPILFALGIGAYFSLPYEPALSKAVGLCLIFGLILLLFWRSYLLRIMMLVILLGTSGFTTASLRSALLSTPVLKKKHGPLMITGVVFDVRHYTDGKLSLVIDHPKIPGLRGETLLNKVRLKVQKFDDLPQPGDRVRIRAGLMPPPAPAMPGGFDYARQIWFQGIGAVGYAISKPEIIEKARGGFILSTRQRLVMAEDIRRAIPDDEGGPSEAGGLAAALITGMRSGISQDVANNMRNSGLAHLLAISGLHMGLLCGAAFFFFRFLLSRSEYVTLTYPIKKWAAVIAIGAGIVYVFLSGGAIPTVRAFIMALVLFLGILTDRKAISLRLVALAAMVILVFTPEALLSVSFQMSFAAVVALVAAYEELGKRGTFEAFSFYGKKHSHLKKVVFYIGTMLLTTLIAEMAIAPFALFHFNKLVQYGLVANLLAMPIMVFWVMPCVTAYLILFPFGLGQLALYPMSYGLDAIMFVAKTVSHTPGSYSLVPALEIWPLIALTLGALWVGIWRQKWRYFGLPVIMVGLVAAFLNRQPDILIDNSGRLIGVRNANQEISLSSLRSGRMTRQRWAQRYGQEKIEKWDKKQAADNKVNWMTCDKLSCLYRPPYKKNHILIALVKNERALPEDCQNAQIIISLVPVNMACPSAALVIDRWDFFRKGGHAIWLPEDEDDEIIIKTVADTRGNRPWSRGR